MRLPRDRHDAGQWPAAARRHCSTGGLSRHGGSHANRETQWRCPPSAFRL